MRLNDTFYVPEAKEDREHIYRWVNSDERAVLRRQQDGYEPVLDATPENKTAAAPLEGAAGVTRRRGSDLILMRISRKAHAETVGARREAVRAQHEGTVDATIDGVNERVSAELKRQGKSPRSGLVFRSGDTPEFEQIKKR